MSSRSAARRDDQIGLALTRVFDRARAFLRGYSRVATSRHSSATTSPARVAEDAVYHALIRGAPDLDRELGEPLARAATDALTAVAHRLDHWAAVVDVQSFDLDVGVGRALEIVEARLAAP